jgi:hypothetical protein
MSLSFTIAVRIQSASELLYEWRCTAKQYVLVTSPYRLMGRIFFSIEHLLSLSLYDILSHEKMTLSFTIAAGRRRRIYSRVQVSWDSRSYITVSDSRLRFYCLIRLAGLPWRYSTPPLHGNARIQVKVKVKLKVTLRLTVGQSVSLVVGPHLGLMTQYLLVIDSYGPVFVGRPLWREDRSVFCICCWPSPVQSVSSPSHMGIATIFYCLSFETSLFVTSYYSQGHGGGIRPRLHTGRLEFYSRQVETYVTTDRESASLSRNNAPNWGLRPDFHYYWTVTGLLMWGALSDERTGLSFTIATDPDQRSHSRVRVPWISRQYFTALDLRLLFLSPSTTSRARVEVSDLAPTQHSCPFGLL